MRKKLMAVLLCAVMTASLFTGCGSSKDKPTDVHTSGDTSTEVQKSDNGKEISITLAFADGDEMAKKAMARVMEDFQKEYPNIKIVREPAPSGSYSDYLKTKDSVGEFPDIVEMRDTAMYVRAGKLEPLTDEQIAIFENTVEFDGKVYTAPMTAENSQGIMYNKKFFKEHGINESPKNFNEFIKICEDVRKAGMEPLVVGGADLWHLGFWFNKIYTDNVTSKNPEFIAQMYAGKTKWTDPDAKQTFNDLIDLFQYVDKGWASTIDSNTTTMLVTEQAAMLFSGSHMFQQIADADPNFELGWFPLPDKEGKLYLVGGSNATGWSLSAEAAKDPAKKEAFDTFLQFFFEKTNYETFLETMNLLPTTKEKVSPKYSEVMNSVMAATEMADEKTLMWNGQIGENELPPEFRNYTYKLLTEILQGTKSVEDGMKELDSQWLKSTADFNPVKNPQ